jgi:hypothetical protein
MGGQKPLIDFYNKNSIIKSQPDLQGGTCAKKTAT